MLSLDPNDLAEMERLLGRKLTEEELKLFSLSSKVRAINFGRRQEEPESTEGKSDSAGAPSKRRSKAAGE